MYSQWYVQCADFKKTKEPQNDPQAKFVALCCENCVIQLHCLALICVSCVDRHEYYGNVKIYYMQIRCAEVDWAGQPGHFTEHW